jgi:hypothetical protein
VYIYRLRAGDFVQSRKIWIDISGIGTVVPGLGDDNIVGPFNIGFDFRYYWYDVTSFHVGSNGYIRFSGGGQLSSPFTPIPNPIPPNDIVCPYTADFDPSSGGTVYYWTNNVDTLIVSWDHVPAWNTPTSTGDHNFQLVLSMVDTSITFNIGPQSGTFFNTSGMVGIENIAGDIGIYNYPTNAIPQNYSIKFYYPYPVTYDIDDIAVTRVQNANSGGFFVETGGDLQANATIKNTGTLDEIDFYVVAQVRQYPSNTVVFEDSFYVAALNTGETLDIDFSETWTLSTPGDYYLRVRSLLPGDLTPSNDQIDVELHVVGLPGELALDDGSSEQTWSWAGGNGGMGIYYVPPAYPVKVTEIKGWFVPGTGLPVLLELYDDDGPNGEPGTQLFSQSVSVPVANWYPVDVSGSDIVIEDGGVYVAWIMTGDGSAGMGLDQNTLGSRQTWEYTGVWAVFRNGETQDAMLRVSVEETLVSEPQMSLTHTPGDLNVTIFNDGSIGAENVGATGPGVTWKEQNGIYVGGPIFGTGAVGSVNGLIGSFFITGDLLNVASNFAGGFTTEPNFDQVTLAILNDAGAPTPYGVDIVQKSYSNSGEEYVFIRYGYVNNSGAALTDFYAGVFIDWDIDVNTYLTNQGGYAPGERLVYQFDAGGTPYYYGVAVLDSLGGYKTHTGGTSAGIRTESFSWISTPDPDPIGAPGDFRSWQGTGPGTIAPGDTLWRTLAIVAGDDLDGIRANAAAAAAKSASLGWTDPLVGIDDDISQLPLEFALEQNYPNPFNPATTLKYTLKENAKVTLKVYNVLGQLVKTLVNEKQTAGFKTVTWDGTNEAGVKVSSGIYIYRIEAKNFVQSRKMILMK